MSVTKQSRKLRGISNDPLGLNNRPLPLSAGGGVAPKPAWVVGTDFDFDPVNDRAWTSALGEKTLAAATTYSGSAGTAQKANFDYVSFAADVLRRTDLGAVIEPAMTQLLQRSGSQFANWAPNGATITALGTKLGIFTGGALIASTGATWNKALAPVQASLVGGVAYQYLELYSAGTSPNAGLFADSSPSGVYVDGPIGDMPTTPSTDLGVLGPVTDYNFGNGNYGFSFAFTPTVTGLYTIGFGPRSAVAGQTVGHFYSGINAGSRPMNPVLTAAATGVRNPDIWTLPIPAGVYDPIFLFDNNSTQQILGVSGGDYVVPTNLNRPQIKRVYN